MQLRRGECLRCSNMAWQHDDEGGDNDDVFFCVNFAYRTRRIQSSALMSDMSTYRLSFRTAEARKLFAICNAL